MIAAAKAFMVLGTVAGVLGILGGLVLAFAWATDRWARRHCRPTFQPDEHSGLFTAPKFKG